MNDPELKEYLHHLQRAEALLDIGRWREAVHELDLHLAKYPGDYVPLCQSAAAYAALGELQKALDRANQAVQSWPEGDWAYRLQSMIFTENGEFKRAFDSAEKAAAIAPDSPLTLLSLAYAQANHGKLDDAVITANALLELSPDAAESHETAGYVALKRESLRDAEEYYLAALAIEPESVNSLNNLGVVYRERAKKGEQQYQEKAIEMFERALKVDPSFKLAENNRTSTLSPMIGKVGAPIGLIVGLMILLSNISSGIRTASESGKFTIWQSLKYYSPFDSNLFFVFLNLWSLLLFLVPIALLLRKMFVSLGINAFGKQEKGYLTSLWSDRWTLTGVLFVLAAPIIFYLFGVYGAGWIGSPFGWLAFVVECSTSLAIVTRIATLYRNERE